MLDTIRPTLVRTLLVLVAVAVAFGGGVALHDPPRSPGAGAQELIEQIGSRLAIGSEQALHTTVILQDPDADERRTDAYFQLNEDGQVYYALQLVRDRDGNLLETQITGVRAITEPDQVLIRSSAGWSFPISPETLESVVRSLGGSALQTTYPNESALPSQATEGSLRTAGWTLNGPDGDPRFEEQTLFRALSGERLLRERTATYRVIAIDEVPEARIGG